MGGVLKLIWGLFVLWIVFLLVIWIDSQQPTHHEFGGDNVEALAPGAASMGIGFADFADRLGLNFQSLRRSYASVDPARSGYGTSVKHVNLKHSLNGSFLVVAAWAVFGLLVALGLSLGVAFFGALGGAAVEGGDGVGQRLVGIVAAIILIVLFAPGWPVDGPVFFRLNDWSHAPARARESAAINETLAQEKQDWLPQDLGADCRSVFAYNDYKPAQNVLPQHIRSCGEEIKSLLTANATMGQEPDPRTESAGIAYLLKISNLAHAGQLDGVDPADAEFAAFGTFATTDYPSMRQEGWRQAAQRYLGLLEHPDTRTDSQDARHTVGYKLSVLAELLYDSKDPASRDMAYRIAVVTQQKLGCTPQVLQGTSDTTHHLSSSSLPTCEQAATQSASDTTGFLGMSRSATKMIEAVLILLSVGIVFFPWGDFPWITLYVPIIVAMFAVAVF